jgi:hypothetical protein
MREDQPLLAVTPEQVASVAEMLRDDKNIVFDPSLRFLHRGCAGLHFAIGNPQTFPGRMWGWCARRSRTFFFSKSDVEDATPEMAAWMAGFLAGNAPAYPRDAEGDRDFEKRGVQIVGARRGALS